MIDTAVIIASWNGKKYLKDCFDSLAGQTYKNFKIIYVDNGSEDGSVDFVRENFPNAAIIEISQNVGFAAGYNLGFRMAMKEKNIQWLIALNNDTKLHENFIEEMVACSKRHPEAGSIQSKVLNFFEPKRIDCVGIVLASDGTAHNRGYGETDKGQYDKEEEIFGANGAAVLYTRESLEKTKLPLSNYFDREHFAFYEDVDLAWRMRLAGFKSFYCPQALARHVHSGTSGVTSLFKAYYLHRNYFLTVFKNYPFGSIMLRTLGWRFLSYIQLIFGVFQKGKKGSEYAKGSGKGQVALIILRAWASVIYSLPDIVRKRKLIQQDKKVNDGEIKIWLSDFGEKLKKISK